MQYQQSACSTGLVQCPKCLYYSQCSGSQSPAFHHRDPRLWLDSESVYVICVGYSYPRDMFC